MVQSSSERHWHQAEIHNQEDGAQPAAQSVSGKKWSIAGVVGLWFKKKKEDVIPSSFVSCLSKVSTLCMLFRGWAWAASYWTATTFSRMAIVVYQEIIRRRKVLKERAAAVQGH